MESITNPDHHHAKRVWKDLKSPSDYHDFRSSRPKVFCKKGVLRNFGKFTRKNLCQSLFFNKIAGQRPTTLLKDSL